MDMPISVPRTSIAQAADDVKARNMILCRFPEIQMVVGKAGRADTVFDPAPLDMIESMVEFRPQEWWPQRLLPRDLAEQHVTTVWNELIIHQLIRPPAADTDRPAVIREVIDAGMVRYDAIQREVAHLRIQEFLHSLGAGLVDAMSRTIVAQFEAEGKLARRLDETDLVAMRSRISSEATRELSSGPTLQHVESLARDVAAFLESKQLMIGVGEGAAREPSASHATRMKVSGMSPAEQRSVLNVGRYEYHRRWRDLVPELNAIAFKRAAPLWTRIVTEELIARSEVLDESLAVVLRQVYAARYASVEHHHATGGQDGSHDHDMLGLSPLPLIDPHPEFDRLQQRLTQQFSNSLRLVAHTPATLAGAGGEMDRSLCKCRAGRMSGPNQFKTESTC